MSVELDASEAAVVRLALKHPGITRTELAHAIGSSSLAVGGLVKRLIYAGALVENGATSSTGGRPAAKLFVSDRMGYCCSHQVLNGRLTSVAMSLSGDTLGRVDRPVTDISGMLRGVGAAELELSVKAGDRPLISSAVAVSGTVERKTNTGEAPWLFGKETIDPSSAAPHSRLVSSASCLISKYSNWSAEGTWLALDITSGLSCEFQTQRGEQVTLDVAHLEPDPSILLVEALDEAIRSAAASRSSMLGNRLADATPRQALASVAAQNDHVACALVDSLVEDTLTFVKSAARSLRPDRLILAANLLDPMFGLIDTIRTGLVRRVDVGKDSVFLVPPRDAIEDRFAGACTAALELRLLEIGRHGGALKVE